MICAGHVGQTRSNVPTRARTFSRLTSSARPASRVSRGNAWRTKRDSNLRFRKLNSMGGDFSRGRCRFAGTWRAVIVECVSIDSFNMYIRFFSFFKSDITNLCACCCCAVHVPYLVWFCGALLLIAEKIDHHYLLVAGSAARTCTTARLSTWTPLCIGTRFSVPALPLSVRVWRAPPIVAMQGRTPLMVWVVRIRVHPVGCRLWEIER